MDKKTTRVIGYVKPGLNTRVETPKKEKKIKENVTETDTVVSEVKEPDLSILVDLQKTKSEKIVKWINSHREFKWGVMCTKLKIDRGNFQRTLKNEKPLIKVELIPQIENFLKTYGYAG